MQFRNLTLLNLTLPKVESAGKEQAVDSLRIGVDVEGNFFLNGQPIEEGALVEAVRELAQLRSDVPVIIMADENSLLRKVTFIMDTCRQAGLETVRLQAR